MDWKQEAVDKLRGYAAQLNTLEIVPLELERLENTYTGIRGAKLDGMPVSGGSGSTREDAMLSNIVHRDNLKRRLEEARLWVAIVDGGLWVAIVDGGLSVLDDDERLALELCYIHKVKGSIDDLCERLALEKSTVYRRRDNALRRFTLALYGAIESI